jgi:prepilin-type N-terminal cleavage/methylation domain-containing protein
MKTNQKAFTLIELFVAIFITSIIATGAYTVLINFQKSQMEGEIRANIQQTARSTIDGLSEMLRDVGYAPGSVTPDKFAIKYADSDSLAFIWYTALDTDSVYIASVYLGNWTPDPTPYNPIDRVLILTIRDTTTGTIICTEPLTAGLLQNYSTNVDDVNRRGLTFDYYDNSIPLPQRVTGCTDTTSCSVIRYIRLSITVMGSDRDPRKKSMFANSESVNNYEFYDRITLNTEVELRNLGYDNK